MLTEIIALSTRDDYIVIWVILTGGFIGIYVPTSLKTII